MSLLDDVQSEVSKLSDAEIAEAAQKIQARQQKARASMSPDRVQKQKDREKHRRALNSAILKAAKAKGLVAAEAPSA